MIRRRVIAHGHVQGVFFRDTVRKAAESGGVAGWARNRDDGTVESVLEGDQDAVLSIVELIRGGPGDARISTIEVLQEKPEGLSGFEVR